MPPRPKLGVVRKTKLKPKAKPTLGPKTQAAKAKAEATLRGTKHTSADSASSESPNKKLKSTPKKAARPGPPVDTPPKKFRPGQLRTRAVTEAEAKTRNAKRHFDANRQAGDVDDRTGLERAYATSNRLYVEGDTLYIAGTQDAVDIVDDAKLPFDGVSRTARYLAAERILEQNPEIDHIVGHSLGASVAADLALRLSTTYELYALPAWYRTKTNRQLLPEHVHSEMYDPISVAGKQHDRSRPSTYNPHAYQTKAKRRFSRSKWTVAEALRAKARRRTVMRGGTF